MTALAWIVEILSACEIPFQAVGGLAARAYGAHRPIVDLDFYIPDDSFPQLLPTVDDVVREGPEHIEGRQWDLTYVVLERDGVRIEIAGADSARLRGAVGDPWSPADVGFDRSIAIEVLGTTIPVMPQNELMAYKQRLGRDVDVLDLYDLAGRNDAEQRLAVYGSLAPGEMNHEQVAGLGGTWTPGAVHGELHSEGWGATYGFPGMRWHPDADAVPVQVLESRRLPEHWARLDRFEGPGYRRTLVPVRIEGRDRVVSHLYVVAA